MMCALVVLTMGLKSFTNRFRFLVTATLGMMLTFAAAPGVVLAQEAPPDGSPVPIPTVGETEFVLQLDGSAGEFTEGVTVSDDGTVYASVSPLGQLVRVGDNGTHEVVGQVDGLQQGDLGMLGVTAHTDGSVYGAVFSSNPDANGVWRFDVESGDVERVAGTEQVTMPNAIAFDADGVMFVTDTIAGAVWMVPPDGTAEPWLEHELLLGTGDLGFGIPVGANGIVVDKDGATVYVAVSEQGTLVAIPVSDDGTAGEPTVYVRLDAVPDGIAIDESGTIYAAQPGINTVSRVSEDGSVEVVASGGNLDGPASVAVGPDGDVLYVANFSGALAAIIPPDGAGPGVVMIPLGD